MIKAAIRASIGSTLKVGILSDEQAEGAPSGTTVLDVGTWNEFGIGVPERSFIRGWYDSALEQNKRAFRALFRNVLAGKLERYTMWEQLGALFVAGIQRRIAAHGDGAYEKNADSTIKKKGSSTPLVDTGQLKSAITYEVEA